MITPKVKAATMPEHLSTYDVDEECAYCLTVHGHAEDYLAKYHAMVLAARWRREHGIHTRSALPTRRRG